MRRFFINLFGVLCGSAFFAWSAFPFFILREWKEAQGAYTESLKLRSSYTSQFRDAVLVSGCYRSIMEDALAGWRGCVSDLLECADNLEKSQEESSNHIDRADVLLSLLEAQIKKYESRPYRVIFVGPETRFVP